MTDVSGRVAHSGRMPELEWLRANGREYRGQWVALNGEELLSHGSAARGVRDEARAKGVQTR